MSRPPLKLVTGAKVYDPRDPDAELARLFAEEARVLAELAAIRRRLPAVRDLYAAKHGLGLMLPGVERLRTLFGPRCGG